MGISLGGLSSGLDTNTMVDQLVAIERQPATTLAKREKLLSERKLNLQDLANRLSTLRGAARALRDPSLFHSSQTVISTSESVASVTGSGAAPGGYQLHVTSLARAEQRMSGVQGVAVAQQQRSAAGFSIAAADDTLHIAVGAGTPVDVAITAGDDLNAIASKINSVLNVGVRANVTSGQLQLTATTAGSAGTFTVTSAGSLASTLNFSQTTAAKDAFKTSTDDVLHIQVGSGSSYNVAITAGSDVSAIRDAINANPSIGVYATVASGKLYIASKTTGAANSIALTSNGSLASDLNLSVTQVGQNADFTFDGTHYTDHASNTITDLLPGASITLKGQGDSSINASESTTDAAAISSKLSAFVNAYNDVMTFIGQKLKEMPVKNPQTSTDMVKGSLFGDSTLQSVQTQLRGVLAHVVGGQASGAPKSLQDLGIDIKAAGADVKDSDARNGVLVFDQTKFNQAFAADSASVQSALNKNDTDPTKEGLSQYLDHLVSPWLGTTGLLQASIDSQDSEIKDLQKREQQINDNADAYGKRLQAQFTQMESSLSLLKSQQSMLSAQLAGLR